MIAGDLYHIPHSQKLERLRQRWRDVTLDSEGNTGRVLATKDGLRDIHGNTISAQIDSQGRLKDLLENRFYYDF